MGKYDIDNRAEQLNPNNDAFWTSRGWDERPDDWEDRVERDDAQTDSSQKANLSFPLCLKSNKNTIDFFLLVKWTGGINCGG